MHFNHGTIPANYLKYIKYKKSIFFLLIFGLISLILISLSLGVVTIPFSQILKSLAGIETLKKFDLIIWNIRMPQILTAVVAGAGLSIAGTVMQSILRNPLGSPFTLGISSAAAFGAAFAVMISSLNLSFLPAFLINLTCSKYFLTISALIFSIIAALIIFFISQLRSSTPEIMVLTGIALGSLFTSSTMFLQYFADDVQLSTMVFWTFGDTGRTNYEEIAVISVITILCSIYFIYNSWNYNAIDTGDETATGLGVNVKNIRLTGMFLSSFLTGVIISFCGVIGFIGLITPHILRKIIGSDNRFLLPLSLPAGAIILLFSDTVARLILLPNVLPVSILTSFIGAPVFLFLVVRGNR